MYNVQNTMYIAQVQNKQCTLYNVQELNALHKPSYVQGQSKQ